MTVDKQWVLEQMASGKPLGYMHPWPSECEVSGWDNFIYGPFGTPCELCGEFSKKPIFSIRMRYEGVFRDLIMERKENSEQ